MQPTKEELLIQSQYRLIERLLESEERWRFALEGSGDGVWDWNIQTGDVVLSKRWKTMLGYEEDEIDERSQDWKDLIHPEDRAEVDVAIDDYLNENTQQYAVEFRMRCKDGGWKWILARGMAVRRNSDGKPLRMIGTHTDISDRKQAEETILRQAYNDELTGLPNQALFYDRLDLEIRKMRRAGNKLALLFIDLDDFKVVNDTLGHDMGDRVLVEAAQRIKKHIRESDTVARFGDDEFTIILSNLENADNSERAAREILTALSAPFQLGGEHVHLSASIGITIYPTDAEAIEDLCKNADQAMYAAKKAGRNGFSYFTPSMQQAAQTRLELINGLYEAIEERQFELYYQPILELSSGHIRKAEALIRWHHPERGIVSPMEFIPLAEESGLIVEIGNLVFREAVERLSEWRSFNEQLMVSINLSPVQFRNKGDSFDSWLSRLQEMEMFGNGLIFEITEGLLLDAEPKVVEQLRQFREVGIKIALDDFGTGYSSLSYLKKFVIDYLKIDRSFVSNLDNDPHDMAITEAVIMMAHKLGVEVVAEGVETRRQQAILAKAGCDYVQGYLYSKPIPAKEFEMLLKRNESVALAD